MRRARDLNPRQTRFVDEYLVDLNATQAAIRAGYSHRTAGAMGHDLLKKPEIQAALQEAQQARAERTEIDQDRVIEELSAVAFSDIGDVIDFTGEALRLKAPKEILVRSRRAVASVRVKRLVEGKGEDAQQVELIEFKFWPKDRALELIGRHFAMFTDKLQHSGDLDLRSLSDDEIEKRIIADTRALLKDPASLNAVLTDPELRKLLSGVAQ